MGEHTRSNSIPTFHHTSFPQHNTTKQGKQRREATRKKYNKTKNQKKRKEKNEVHARSNHGPGACRLGCRRVSQCLLRAWRMLPKRYVHLLPQLASQRLLRKSMPVWNCVHD